MATGRIFRQPRADWLPRGIISGFIAAVAMLFTFFPAYGVAYLVSSQWLPQAAGLGLARDILSGLIHNSLTDLAGSNLYGAAGLHFVVAIMWALGYAYYAEPRLEGSGWARGLRFSLLPWLLSIVVFLPLAGGGLLGLELQAGPLPVIGNLILHLAYGATLGTVYGPLGDVPADSLSRSGPRDDFETMRRGEVLTAEGIVGGLVVGLLASLAVAQVVQASQGSPINNIPQAAFVLGMTLIGGVLGGLVGSFAGLTPSR